MQFLPRVGRSHRGSKGTLDVAYEAFHPGNHFHRRRLLVAGDVAFGGGTVGLQAVARFELLTELRPRVVVVERFVQRELRGMHFVDGDVEMQVVGVPVNHGNPLMFGKSKRAAKVVFDPGKGVAEQVFTSSKGDDQVIGSVPFGPLIAALDRLHFVHGPTSDRPTGSWSRPPLRPGRFSPFESRRYAIQMTDLAFGCRLHRSLLGNHSLAAKLEPTDSGIML